jgi:dipeptidyl-peptidase-3
MKIAVMRKLVAPGVLVLLVLTCACSRQAAPTAAAPAPERRYLLETVDDAAVVQLYADSFDKLSLRDKTLTWHLYQAALAGRDIFYDQRHRNGLEMRGILEAIVMHPAGIDAAVMQEILRYTKLYWINSGAYSSQTSRKFVLKTTPQAFAAAARQAAAAGATFPLQRGETLDALLARLQPMFFDPQFEPISTNKTPAPGEDMLQASAANLYSGVRLADLKGFTEEHGLESRLVKENGRLKEEVYRIGGRYSKELSEVVRHLEAAIPFAPEPTANALRALIQFYKTGDEVDRKKADIAWVADKASTVDTINGFIEVYLDPRGIKGAWEAVVFSVNQEKTKRIHTFADNAQWFEDHMPYDTKYRKPHVTGIVANAIDVVVEAGRTGPVSPAGINLPNDDTIRERYGSKSVTLDNVREANDKGTPGGMRAEFSASSDESDRGARFGTLGGELLTDMHEVIGHASGAQSPSLKGTPQQAIREFFSALEEGRADLVGLYFIGDPRLAELGILPAADQDAVMRAEYESYTRNVLTQLRRVRQGTQLEEDHMRNRQMVVRWLVANTKAISQRTRDGKTYLEVVDPKAFREGAGRLLAEVQRIKSEGDYAAAKQLFETYGIHFDAALRDEVVTRVDALKLPAYTAFVMPKLTPVMGTSGEITDVTISYPMDLTKQMLEYSATSLGGRLVTGSR